MVQAAARWLAGKGFRDMVIFVMRDNTPARKFYEAIGGIAERERVKDVGGFPAAEVGYRYELCEEGLRMRLA